MTPCVALLRAVNVGGTGKLPMVELQAMGEACSFSNCRTWIASGNLLFETALPEAEIKAALEAKLASYASKPVEVFVRTAAEMAAIVAADPFPDAHPSRHLVYFQDAPPRPDFIARCRDKAGERLALGKREVYVDYGEGIRFTKLKIPGKTYRTGRSMGTVRKLAALLHPAPK
jgi:uncharacterized protein (DUF1697 family)